MNLLYRYIPGAVGAEPHSGHGANWMSWCIYQIFKQLGFEIDTLGWLEKQPPIFKAYDVVFDIGRIQYLSDGFKGSTVKILFLQGADNVWRNRQGIRRALEASARKRHPIPYFREVPEPEEYYRAIELADFVICLGNERTRATYPEQYRHKLHMMDVIGAEV